MKKPYHIVTRAASESAAVIEQFCQSNGQILLPIVNLIQSASQVVETVLHEIQVHSLEAILVLSAEQLADGAHPARPVARSVITDRNRAASNWRTVR